jgi:hypothetical protein
MSARAQTAEPSWWRLHADIAWGRSLLAIATMHERASVRPDIFLFLGDRYWRLARRHFVEGRQRDAQRLVRKARMYFMAGGGPEPPPLSAASMPIPEVPSFTWAFGAARGSGRSNDAA